MIPFAALTMTLFSASRSEEPVIVDRIPLTPQANLVFADGTVDVHPYVGLGVGWGKDPRGRTEGTSGWGTGLVGSAVRWQPTAVDQVHGDVSARVRGSENSHNGTYVEGQGNLKGRHEAQRSWFGGGIGYLREDKFIPSAGGNARTDTLSTNLTGHQDAESGSFNEKLAASNEEYDGVATDRDRLLTVAEVSGSLSAAGTRWGLVLRGEGTDYRDQTRYSSSVGGAGLAMAEFGIGAQSSIVAQVGAMIRHYEQGAGDHQVIAPAFSLAVVLNQLEGGYMSLVAASKMDDNDSGNAEVFRSITADVRVAMAPPWQLAIQALAGIGRDTGVPSGNDSERRTELEARVGLEYYLLGEGSVVRLEVSGEDYESNRTGDWQGARVDLHYFSAW